MNATPTDGRPPGTVSLPPSEKRIIEALARLPQAEAPPSLYPGIMARLSPKRPHLWHRLRFRLTRPVTVRFVPWRWAPGLAAAALALVLAVQLAPFESRTPLVPGDLPGAGTATLTLAFEHPGAQEVALIGSFSGWDPQSPLIRVERRGSRWTFRLEVPPGRYEYAFVVDGREIVPDPQAVFSRRDGFGAVNSIVYATPGDHARL